LEIAMALLSPADQFPVLSLTPPGGEILALPGALAGGFGVVLFYRGSWCPYCNAQLRAFQRATAGLAEVGARWWRCLLTTRPPVGNRSPGTAIAQATGAFLNEDPLYVQSTGFVLDPAGRVVVSVYSSGAIGRLVPEDVVGLIRYLREHAESATSA
jgi:hypothetical protein